MTQAPPIPYRMKPETFEPHARTVALINMARGGVVFDANVARALGEVLLEQHYGSQELARQRPLLVADKEDHWRVEGGWNRDHKLEGAGPFFLSMYKYDGRVVDIGQITVLHPHPDVTKIIEEHRPRDERQ
jgi:hypothetical protein